MAKQLKLKLTAAEIGKLKGARKLAMEQIDGENDGYAKIWTVVLNAVNPVLRKAGSR